jgi:hypothetical protein
MLVFSNTKYKGSIRLIMSEDVGDSGGMFAPNLNPSNRER